MIKYDLEVHEEKNKKIVSLKKDGYIVFENRYKFKITQITVFNYYKIKLKLYKIFDIILVSSRDVKDESKR